MNDDANWCEKTKRTLRARTYCICAFRSVVCIQGGGGGAERGVVGMRSKRATPMLPEANVPEAELWSFPHVSGWVPPQLQEPLQDWASLSC